ncbi:MAG: UDP-N-acetylmuramate--L-alanine ligase [Flavobacteriales bacterium]|nr:MAG: UDP-N-acetylmuramate--L-alanine ligase [Flavobacteriales bacterium]
MSATNAHTLFFIGIGGIGMSGLARYFRRRGALVAGYDRTPSEITGQLQGEGIHLMFSEDPRLIPEEFQRIDANEVLVVRTPAVPVTSPLLKYWEERGARIVKRAELLGLITRDRPTIAVAGTHGKTTVSTMVAHLLREGGVKCNAFLGGVSVNYRSNILLDDNAVVNVVEADEYDRSFLQLRPTDAIITAMDPDHLDIYGTADAMYDAYAQFAALCTGTVLAKRGISGHLRKADVKEYTLNDPAFAYATNVRVQDGAYRFDLHAQGHHLVDLTLGMPGRHNVENAVAASTLALQHEVSPEKLRHGLATFRGVERRFDVRFKGAESVYVDDYAHHPQELEAAIRSARELYAGRTVTGIFQPHLFTRTRDFAEGFAQALALLDELILLEIYPAREEPIPGINSAWLLEQVPMAKKTLVPKEHLLGELENRRIDVLLTLGAGDIDRSVPAIVNLLNQREQ